MVIAYDNVTMRNTRPKILSKVYRMHVRDQDITNAKILTKLFLQKNKSWHINKGCQNSKVLPQKKNSEYSNSTLCDDIVIEISDKESVFHPFRQDKFDSSGSILSSSQF